MDQWIRTGSCKRKADESYDSTGKVVESQDIGRTPATSSKQIPPPGRHEREKFTAKGETEVPQRLHRLFFLDRRRGGS